MQIKVSFKADDVEILVKGLDQVREAAPILAYNVLDVIANQVKRNARSYLGHPGPPGFPWNPIGQWARRSRVKNVGNFDPLLDTGAMRTGIKVTSRRRGANPKFTVSATDWKSDIHEYGHSNNGKRIPARPFMAPAVISLEYDSKFQSALENFLDDNIEALAYSKQNRAAKWFYMEHPEMERVEGEIITKHKLKRRSNNGLKRVGRKP